AIVGAGRIAQDHVRAVADSPGVEVAVVIDPDRGAARRLADRCGATSTGADVGDVPGDVDGAIICSPTSVHAEQARELISRGVGVLVEKPFCNDLDEAIALFDLAEQKGTVLMPAQILRHLPLIDVVRETISSGRFGTPVQAIERRLVDRADNFPWWRDLPAFLVSHWGSHSVDLVCHLFDDEAVRVVCEADSVRSTFGVVDDFTLLARFRSGLRMVSAMSFSSRSPVHDLVLIGTGATVTLDCYRTVAVDGEILFEGDEDDVLAEGFRRQLQAFAELLRSGGKTSGDTVLPSLRLLAAAERAAIAGDGASVPVENA
ncbi:MAG: Gfo/Idh/MocA family oxidoreductase, partial [Microbacterium sp.]